MAKFFLKNSFAIIVGLLALLVYLPFYYQFSHDLGSSSILSEDQRAYIGNIFHILYPVEFAGDGYWDNFLESALVSPDLVKRSEDIEIYKKSLADEGIEFDAICTKNQNINRWQS